MATRRSALLVQLFWLVWSASTATVFVAASHYFASRYLYISAFGLGSSLVFSVYAILGRLWRQPLVAPIALAALVAFVGYRRIEILNEAYAEPNRTFALVQDALEGIEFPPRSQIVLNGIHAGHDNWFSSSGYLQHVLGRREVEGIMGVASVVLR